VPRSVVLPSKLNPITIGLPPGPASADEARAAFEAARHSLAGLVAADRNTLRLCPLTLSKAPR
jgi:hypothetical protein